MHTDNLIICLLYILPLLISMGAGLFIKKNNIETEDPYHWYIILGCIPGINFMTAFCCLLVLSDHKDKINFALPNYQKLSPKSQRLIQEAKEEEKSLIAVIKQQQKEKIQNIKTEDEQKVLLGKLGLTLGDLERLRDLNREKEKTA